MNRVAPSHTIRRVVIVAKLGPSPEGARLAERIGEWLEGRGIEPGFERNTARAIGRERGVAGDELSSEVDLVIVAGGDGTLLSVARVAAPVGIPILPVNLGSLGFLTELQPGEIFDGLEAVLAGHYAVEERQMLRVRPVLGGKAQPEHALLNDVVIAKSALARMISIEVRVDDMPVATYTSDGLIIATPTGSTAYNLSAGGPILDPRMSAFVISPICPHSMSYRPLVVPGGVTVEAILRSDGEAVYLTLDGQIGFPMEVDDALTVDAHPNPVRLVRIGDRGFFEVLRRKLHWGER
ncbi:MAG TPA: NAD(+)/NADH kinase [Candidatus Polarisedimenticolaceae bacterium]|nr:NAD(+)/NADH kinase [Candidatus Polarisedimenticolaceae bacterium]